MGRQGINLLPATTPFRPMTGGQCARDKRETLEDAVALTFRLQPKIDPAIRSFGILGDF
jgi:hypothetical protein